MFSRNLEERVARDVLAPGAIPDRVGRVIIVADSKNIKRSLNLAFQFAEYEIPMMFVLNMVDEAEKQGIHINAEKLSAILGIPVVRTVARAGQGIDDVISALDMMQLPAPVITHSDDTDEFMERVKTLLPSADMSYKALALLILSNDPGIHRYVRKTWGHETAKTVYSLAESLNEGYAETDRKSVV
jgi:ferrous iron transport protein B